MSSSADVYAKRPDDLDDSRGRLDHPHYSDEPTADIPPRAYSEEAIVVTGLSLAMLGGMVVGLIAAGVPW